MSKVVRDVFCPSCRGFNVECTGVEPPQFIISSDYDDIGSTEYYECKDCGHSFTVEGTYTMCMFFFSDGECDAKEEYEVRRE